MANLLQTSLITEVRRMLDEITITGELVIADTNMEDVASSNFSDTDISDRLNDAARYIAARVKSNHLPSLISNITPTQVNTYLVDNNNKIYLGKSESPKFLRLLGSRVHLFDGTEAMRRTHASHRKLEASGLPASSNNPVYVFEDCSFDIYGDSQNPAGAYGKCVLLPVTTTYETSQFTIVGTSLALTSTAFMQLGQHMVGASVYVDNVLYTTIQTVWSESSATLAGTPADTSGVLKIIVPAAQFLDEKFEAACIQHAVASCYQTLRLLPLANIARQNFVNEVAPYVLPRVRLGIDDQPQQTEPQQ